MTPAAPADARAPNTDRRASATQRTVPGRRRKLSGSPRGPVPRRVSGPVTAPPLAPRPAPGERRAPTRRPAAARKPTLSARLAAFLRSLPDHPLLDRIVRGRAWIPLLGVMLVGIVAMQVELLKLNATTGRSIELISSLQSRNDILRAEVAAASDPNRIERLAGHMGMTMPGPESITFVNARSASVRRALARIRVPDLAAFEAALRVSNAGATIPAPTLPATTGPTTSTTGTNTSTTGTNTSTTGTTTATTGTGTTATTATRAPATSSTTPAQTGAPSAPPATVP